MFQQVADKDFGAFVLQCGAAFIQLMYEGPHRMTFIEQMTDGMNPGLPVAPVMR